MVSGVVVCGIYVKVIGLAWKVTCIYDIVASVKGLLIARGGAFGLRVAVPIRLRERVGGDGRLGVRSW